MVLEHHSFWVLLPTHSSRFPFELWSLSTLQNHPDASF